MEDGQLGVATDDQGQTAKASSATGNTILELEPPQFPFPLPLPQAPSAPAENAGSSKPPGYVYVPKPTRVEGVSKRVAKRLWRQEMWKAKKVAKKEAKKTAKQQRRQEQRGQHKAEGGQEEEHGVGQDTGQQQPDKEKEKDSVERQERWVARSIQRQEMREDFVRRCREGARVVLDCGFEEQMTEKELKSMGQQVMYVYASNKRAASPCFVHATELGPKLEQRLSGVAGTQEWQGFEREVRSYLDVFASERDKLVYLTSDSPHTLTTWDRSAIYIIGGIVDRNRLKGATYTKAQAQGIATAKFPLHEYVTLGSTHVLAVNHVFDILLEFQRTNDWRAAFGKVLPQRKIPNWKADGEPTAAIAGGRDGGEEKAAVVEAEAGDDPPPMAPPSSHAQNNSIPPPKKE